MFDSKFSIHQMDQINLVHTTFQHQQPHLRNPPTHLLQSLYMNTLLSSSSQSFTIHSSPFSSEFFKNMGVLSVTYENTSSVSAARLFSALIVNSSKLIPLLVPHVVKGVDVIQGDGGPGTIEQVNFVDGFKFRYVKQRINELDEVNCVCKYELIEGGPVGEKLEKIGYEVKIEGKSDGGSVCRMTSRYYGVGEFEVDEEEIKDGKETSIGIYKVVEDYLLNNPQVYA